MNKNSHRVLSSLIFSNNINSNLGNNITNINNNFDFRNHANSIRMNYINSGINKNKINKNGNYKLNNNNKGNNHKKKKFY